MSKHATASVSQPSYDRSRVPVFTDSDEMLAMYAAEVPGAVNTAQCAATAAWKRARQIPSLGGAVDGIWNDVRYRSSDLSQPPAKLLRISLEAQALFANLVEISPGPYYSILQPVFGQPTYAGFANTEAVRKALLSRPGTAHYLRQFDAKVAEEEENRRVEAERYQREDAPRVFLGCVRAKGVSPQVTPEGDLIAPPGTNLGVLLPSELQTLKDWKPQLVAVLQAEAASAQTVAAKQPVVLA